MDARDQKLSHLLIHYSCHLQPGENILIDFTGEECIDLIRQLVKDAYAAGARPYVNHRDSRVTRELLLGADQEQLEFLKECELFQMKGMDAYIAVRGAANNAELADVPAVQLNRYNQTLDPVQDYRVSKTKWVILRYPGPSMAQLANTSQEAFEAFFYNVCTLDYAKMSRAMDPLKQLMDQTDRVQIKGPGTDLTFSIKGIGAVKCDGGCNIPDGEVYTAPSKIRSMAPLPIILLRWSRDLPMKTSGLKSGRARSFVPQPMIQNESTSCWIRTKAHGISENFLLA